MTNGSSPTSGHAPHPHVGGRTAVFRALAAWRMEWPGAPRVVLLTGSPGSGASRLVTGFLMLCDPEYRKRLPLDALDPATVPPELPAPAVPSPARLTAAQLAWMLADHFALDVRTTAEIYPALGALEQPVTLVVPDVDLAGPVRAGNGPTALVREVLKPLAATESVRLLVEVDRSLTGELAEGLPPGTVQIIDLDEPQWADPQGLARHAEAALDPRFGAPELPFTTDPEERRALAERIARRAGGNHLTVELAVRGILLHPDGFDPTDERYLPSHLGEALDLHAHRLGSDPVLLRHILTPLALAEGDGLPAHLWPALASAVSGQDLRQAIAEAMALAGPFVLPQRVAGEGEAEDGERTLFRLAHPGLAQAVRAGLPDVPGAQYRIAMALLEAVPDQDWSRADPYVRDYIAGHTLEAGLLPQLLTDPGLFVHADPVPLRAAVEEVPRESLGAPAHTYLRTAPLLTRSEAPPTMRAGMLETAFIEDGLPEYASAVHQLGLDLPWRTLWHVPVAGVSTVVVGHAPTPEGGSLPVAACTVPAGTPGAVPLPDSPEGSPTGALLVYSLEQPHAPLEVDPLQITRPDQESRAAAPLGVSHGADYVRIWDRARADMVTALISDQPLTGVDLSPDGVLLVATERGVRALRVRHEGADPPHPRTPAATH